MSATVLDLAAMTPRAQAIWCEAYQLGYRDGIARGREQVEAEDREAWARLRQTMRAAAQAPDYATLCERRGQPERAERTRRLWDRGLV